MTPEDRAKVAFCREWFEADGVCCPGCGAALETIAHQQMLPHNQSLFHYRGGDRIIRNGSPMSSTAGMAAGQSVRTSDPRLCRYDADDLTSLVLIGSGFVGSH